MVGDEGDEGNGAQQLTLTVIARLLEEGNSFT